jgi:hypothetical protein
MMPVHDGDELKVVMFAYDAPERQHQVIVIARGYPKHARLSVSSHIDDKV